jgi:tRNA (guanine37-N1)-methyltransferase
VVAAYALIVPLSQGEAARRIVASLGIGRSDLKLGRRDGLLLIPLSGPAEVPIPEARVELTEFESYGVPRTYKDVATVPADLRPLLPSAFDVVGDLVLIKLPPALRAHGAEIGRAILQAHANVKGVFHDSGVGGEHRLRRLVHLAGEERTRTIHSEYGARFYVDVATAYFSPRLANEHQRVALEVQPGEWFLDATAGVGPFSVLAAKRRIARRISAIDLNHDAVVLLRQNLELNRVEGLVEVHEGDSVRLMAEFAGFQRAAINLPHGGEPILRAAWKVAAEGATIHYNSIVASQALDAIGRRLLEELRSVTERGGELLATRIVHAYSPTDVMAAFDLLVQGKPVS